MAKNTSISERLNNIKKLRKKNIYKLEEIVIEVTSKCNLDCNFCFNKNSFAEETRKQIDLDKDKIIEIIDKAAELKIPYIRFSGGEPLLRKDIFELLKYAKSKNFKEIRLNTNGLLIDEKIAKELEKYVDNILIALNAYSKEKEQEITKVDSFNKRIKALSLLKQTKIKIIRSGTIALKENIENFDKIYQIVKELNLDDWEWYRPIANKKDKNLVSKEHLSLLINKLNQIKTETAKEYPIANALPFCILGKENMTNVAKISLGAKYDDGHSRLIVDPRGFIKPSYFIIENLAQYSDIEKAWSSDYIKKLHSLDFVDTQCKSCPFLQECLAGSRFDSKLNTGDYFNNDSLMYEPFVSVIIPTYNQKELLSLSIKSLLNQDYPKDKYEIIVVDDGSTDGTKELVKNQKEIKYLFQEDLGFRAGQARNLGAKNAKGEILIFIDSDIIPSTKFISSHIAAQNNNIILGYSCSYGTDYKYDIKEVENKLNNLSSLFQKEFRDNIFIDKQKSSSKTNTNLWYLFVTNNFSIKKEIFDKFKFDDSFKGWGEEDIDLGYRLYKAGHEIKCCKSCLALHTNTHTTVKNYTKEKFLSLLKNMKILYNKHKNKEIKEYIIDRFTHLPEEFKKLSPNFLNNLQ